MATKRNTNRRSTTNKSSRKRATRKATPRPEVIEVSEEMSSVNNSYVYNRIPFGAKLALLVLIGVGLFWLVRNYRGQIIVATVNQTPIWRQQLNSALVEKYGDQELEQMVAEQLLTQLASREGVSVTDTEINQELDLTKERLGGEENFSLALEQYGMTEADLLEQIRLNLIVRQLQEKLFSVEVSDQEVRTYFDDNSQIYGEQTFADVEPEIRDQLRQQKLQQEFGRWFEEQRTAANIQTFI
jgi:foldase protein PrsA